MSDLLISDNVLRFADASAGAQKQAAAPAVHCGAWLREKEMAPAKAAGRLRVKFTTKGGRNRYNQTGVCAVWFGLELYRQSRTAGNLSCSGCRARAPNKSTQTCLRLSNHRFV